MPTSSKRAGAPQSQITDSDLKYQAQELGWFGRAFGSGQQAAIVFAGGTALICVAGLVAVGVYATPGPEKSETLNKLSTIAIAALTFLGGIVGGRISK
jgi:hypothetical protein